VRIFADTNVLASAFGTRGLCTDLLEAVIEEHQLVVSERVVRELKGVLLRKFRMPAPSCESVLTFVRSFEVVSEARLKPDISGLDNADLSIFASAIEARCAVFVTGDRLLLERVRTERTIKAVSPRDCWRLLKK
jgi:predicted nucleic acid-binding protein